MSDLLNLMQQIRATWLPNLTHWFRRCFYVSWLGIPKYRQCIVRGHRALVRDGSDPFRGTIAFVIPLFFDRSSIVQKVPAVIDAAGGNFSLNKFLMSDKTRSLVDADVEHYEFLHKLHGETKCLTRPVLLRSLTDGMTLGYDVIIPFNVNQKVYLEFLIANHVGQDDLLQFYRKNWLDTPSWNLCGSVSVVCDAIESYFVPVQLDYDDQQ